MANTFKFGNGKWATKEGSVLAYNDESNNFKPLPFAFTRNSIATYVDSDGFIKVSGKNEPRIDYLNDTNGSLLLEPERTNIALYSQLMTKYPEWSPTNTVISPSSVVSPDGNQNSFKLVANGNASAHYIAQQFNNTTDYRTISFFAKAGEQKVAAVGHGIGVGELAYFDLENGSIIKKLSSAAYDTNIEDYGNGWYRCSISYYNNTNPVRYAVIAGCYSESITYTGNNTDGIYVWGPQIELGEYPTSYIYTDSNSTKTRAAEVCESAGNSQIFNDSEGVLYFESNTFENGLGDQWISINDGTASNRIMMAFSVFENKLRVFFTDSVNYDDSTTVIRDHTQNQKIALRYDSSTQSTYIFNNGYLVKTIPQFGDFTSMTNIDLHNSTNQGPFYGRIKGIIYDNTALTNLQMETLTSWSSLNELISSLNLKAL